VFPSGFPTNNLYAFLFSTFMLCPYHPPWPDHSSYTWQSIETMKLLVMQFLAPHDCVIQSAYNILAGPVSTPRPHLKFSKLCLWSQPTENMTRHFLIFNEFKFSKWPKLSIRRFRPCGIQGAV
jgi:hypothetical protein